MPDYKTHDPKGWCGDPKRGAALGRPTVHRAPKDFNGRIYLRRIRLDSGGYDPNGTYFGAGEPLFWYSDEDGEIDGMIRALGRDWARQRVLAIYPNAKIRR